MTKYDHTMVRLHKEAPRRSFCGICPEPPAEHLCVAAGRKTWQSDGVGGGSSRARRGRS
eukprot:SAG31_NODE_12093_length_969_cov_1.158621_2_plen_58_part_01